MEIAFKYGTWELLRHEQIPETQALAAHLFKAKIFFSLHVVTDYSRILVLKTSALHRLNANFPLNLCN